MENKIKRFLSLALALMMVFSMMPQITLSTKAEGTGTKVYLIPTSDWDKENARFAVYYFNNTTNGWANMTDTDDNGVYEGTVPAGYSEVIFGRMNGATTENNWDNKWNQTHNLEIPESGAKLFIINDPWNSSNTGYWCPCIIAGDNADLFGASWDTTKTDNAMEMNESTGMFEKTYTNVGAGTYEFKVTDGFWTNAWPAQNYTLTTTYTKSNVTITFDGTNVTAEAVCAHASHGTDGKCTDCGETVEHTPGDAATCYTAQTCTVCDAIITAATGEHDYGTDGKCKTDGCTATCSHVWDDGTCGVCDYECTHVAHDKADGKCTLCGKEVGHNYVDGKCVCGAEDPTYVAPNYVAYIGTQGYPSLQAAIDEAVDGDTITLVAQVTENVTITQQKGVDLVIDGANKHFTGVMTVFGNGWSADRTETLTIKNVVFQTAEGADSCIVSPDKTANNAYSYSHNVTVEGCTFKGIASNPYTAAAIRQRDGGDKNWTVKNCTADENMHSLLQVNNVDDTNGLVVDGCTINSKNGINLNSTVNAEIKNCTFNVKGYAVRSGVSSGGNLGVEKKLTLTDNVMTSACDDGDAVVMLRASSVDTNLTMTENAVFGTTHISGTTDATNVSADANYWDGKTAPVVAAGSTSVVVDTYYTTAAVNAETGEVTLNNLTNTMNGLTGTGEKENPYLINNLEDLKSFRDHVNTCAQDGSSQYTGKYIKLTADIDLYEEDEDGNQISWEPIGSVKKDHGSFYGTFDGDGHTISNLYVNMTEDGAGFFAKTSGGGDGPQAVIKNITFNNVDVSSTGSYVGGVIANAGGNSVVSNITVTGDVYVTGYGYVGGIVGHGYPDIDDCHVKANDGSWVHGNYWCVGGIIGYAGEGGTIITDSSVSGLDISSVYGGAAAVAGLLQDGNKLTNVSASNVEVTSNSDYCMGYIAGNGEASTLTEVKIDNVSVTANGKEITSTDAAAILNNELYTEVEAAIAAAKDGDTVTLMADVTINSCLNVGSYATEGTVTIDGNGKTIKASDSFADKYMIDTAWNLTLKNVTLDGNNKTNGGVQFYDCTGTVENITCQNLTGGTAWAVPVHVNTSALTVKGTLTFTGCKNSYISAGVGDGFTDGTASVDTTGTESEITVALDGAGTTLNPGTNTVAYALAQVENVYYGNVAEAIAAAQEGDTLTIYAAGEYDISNMNSTVKVVLENENATVKGSGNLNVVAPAGDYIVYVEGKHVVVDAALNAANMTLGDSFSLNFWVKSGDLRDTNLANYKAVMTAPGKTPVEITGDQWIPVKWDGVDYFQIPFAGLAAKEMTVEVEFQIFNGNKAESDKFTESLRKNAEDLIKQENLNAKLRTALVDMLNYGTAAQKEFTPDITDYANKNIAAYQDLATKSYALENAWEGGTIGYGSNLELKNEIILHVWYKAANVATVKVNNEVVGADKITNRIGESVKSVAVTGLAVKDGFDTVTVEFFDKSGNSLGAVTESVASYLKYMLDKSNDSNGLYDATAKFITSAKAYFDSVTG